MSQDDLMMYSKIVSLLIFFPMFVGITFWAYRPKNKAMFDQYAQIPLQDD